MVQHTLRQLTRFFNLLKSPRYLRRKFYLYTPDDIAKLCTDFRLRWEWLPSDETNMVMLVHTPYYDDDDNYGIYERVIQFRALVTTALDSPPWSMEISSATIHNMGEFTLEV